MLKILMDRQLQAFFCFPLVMSSAMMLHSLGRRMQLSKFCPTSYMITGIRLKTVKYTYEPADLLVRLE